jgi:hypothetical protein
LFELELATNFEPILVTFQLEHDHLFFELLLPLIFLRDLLCVRVHKDLPIKLAQNTVLLLLNVVLLILIG